jgi:ABC-2 type transport system permease protein
MRRYLEIYWLMIRNSLIREMSFKANFILWMVVEFLWFLGQVVFLEVLFSHVDAIGDWSKWECVLLVGTHQITAQLFQAFFYVNLAELPDLIRSCFRWTRSSPSPPASSAWITWSMPWSGSPS